MANANVLTFLMLMFLLSLPSLYADRDINYTGANNFKGGQSAFNSNIDLSSVQSYTKVLTDGFMAPLVVDLNNDGQNEIVVVDNADIKIYHDKELTIDSVYSYGTEERISNIIAFDVDADGFNEIVFAREETENMTFLQYNSTGFFGLDSYFSFASLPKTGGANAGDVMIACGAANNCVMAYTKSYLSATATESYLWANGFNKTGTASTVTLGSNNGGGSANKNQAFCFPKFEGMTYADYNANGVMDYIFTVGKFSEFTSDEKAVHIFGVTYTGATTAMSFDYTPATGLTTFDTSAGFDCHTVNNGYGRYLSNVLVGVWREDTQAALKKDFVFAVQHETDQFYMGYVTSTGSLLDTFPSLSDAEGQLISNVFQASVFDDSLANDFCAVGYRNANQEVDIICGSMRDTYGLALLDNLEFIYPADGLVNISNTYNLYNPLSMSLRASTQDSDGLNTDEVLTPHGVYFLDRTTCSLSGFCDATNLYALNLDAAVQSVDAERFGLDDIIAITPTTLYYVDDGQSNGNGYITSILTNPCITDTILQVNTTLKVDVVIEDTNNELLGQDTVSAIITVYKDSPNEVSYNVTGAGSGSQITFSGIVLNATVTTGTLEIIGFDDANPTDQDIVIKTFSVANNGVVFGDSSCSIYSFTPGVSNATNATSTYLGTNLDDNIIQRTLDPFIEMTGLGIFAVFMLAMLILNIFVVFNGIQSRHESRVIIFSLMFLNGIGFFLGVMTQVIPMAIFWSLLALIVIAAAVYVTRAFVSKPG